MSENTESYDQIDALVIESRRRQGLPDHIEDPAFLSALAAALLTPKMEMDRHDHD